MTVIPRSYTCACDVACSCSEHDVWDLDRRPRLRLVHSSHLRDASPDPVADHPAAAPCTPGELAEVRALKRGRTSAQPSFNNNGHGGLPPAAA